MFWITVGVKVKVMVFHDTFNLYQFDWRMKPEHAEKTTNVLQVIDKTWSQNVVSSTSRHERDLNFQL